MHQPPSAAVSFGTESARFSKRWSLLCVCAYERRGNLERKEKQKQRDGAGREARRSKHKKRKSKEEARTAIRNKCAARLSYQGDRCIIIG